MTKIEKEGTVIYPVSVPAGAGLRTINFYIVEQGRSLSLIDAGIHKDECWDELHRSLKRYGFAMKDLTEIILTHHHPDHIGLVNRILEHHEIPIYAPKASLHWLRRDETFMNMRVEFFDRMYREMDCGIDGERQSVMFKESLLKYQGLAIQSDILTMEEGSGVLHFQVIEVPGHAPDHIALYDPHRKWLFAGDHLIGHISSSAIIEPDSEGNRIPVLREYIQSLTRCLSMDIETIFSGHGDVINNPAQLIKERLTSIHDKSQKLLEMIKGGVSTGSQLAKSYYESRYEKLFFLVMSEIIGQLDYLEAGNLIHKQYKQGIYHYYA